MDEPWELQVDWYGPIGLDRVRDEDFTPSMLDICAGLYLWGAERGDEFQVLYVGQSEDPAARQREHMRGTLGKNLARLREQRWVPHFWAAALSCEDFCSPRVPASRVRKALDHSEKALIYKTSPKWNRSNRGYIELSTSVRVENRGRRPDQVPRIIRLNRGSHA